MCSLVPRLSHCPVFDRLQLHTASDQKLEGGKAWERGYTHCVIKAHMYGCYTCTNINTHVQMFHIRHVSTVLVATVTSLTPRSKTAT